MVERLPSAIETAMLTPTATIINKHLRANVVSKFVRDTWSQSVTSQDIISTILHKLISSNRLMAPDVHPLAKTIDEGASDVDDLYEWGESVPEISPSPPSLGPSDSASSRPTQRSRHNQRTKKNENITNWFRQLLRFVVACSKTLL